MIEFIHIEKKASDIPPRKFVRVETRMKERETMKIFMDLGISADRATEFYVAGYEVVDDGTAIPLFMKRAGGDDLYEMKKK